MTRRLCRHCSTPHYWDKDTGQRTSAPRQDTFTPERPCPASMPTCPSCMRAQLEIVTDGKIGVPVAPAYHLRDAQVPIKWHSAPFAACPRCEFCLEIQL